MGKVQKKQVPERGGIKKGNNWSLKRKKYTNLDLKILKSRAEIGGTVRNMKRRREEHTRAGKRREQV